MDQPTQADQPGSSEEQVGATPGKTPDTNVKVNQPLRCGRYGQDLMAPKGRQNGSQVEADRAQSKIPRLGAGGKMDPALLVSRQSTTALPAAPARAAPTALPNPQAQTLAPELLPSYPDRAKPPQQPAVTKPDSAAANRPGPSSVDDLLTETAPAAAVAKTATAPLPTMTASMAGSAAAMAESVAALARNTAADREAAKAALGQHYRQYRARKAAAEQRNAIAPVNATRAAAAPAAAVTRAGAFPEAGPGVVAAPRVLARDASAAAAPSAVAASASQGHMAGTTHVSAAGVATDTSSQQHGWVHNGAGRIANDVPLRVKYSTSSSGSSSGGNSSSSSSGSSWRDVEASAVQSSEAVPVSLRPLSHQQQQQQQQSHFAVHGKQQQKPNRQQAGVVFRDGHRHQQQQQQRPSNPAALTQPRGEQFPIVYRQSKGTVPGLQIVPEAQAVPQLGPSSSSFTASSSAAVSEDGQVLTDGVNARSEEVRKSNDKLDMLLQSTVKRSQLPGVGKENQVSFTIISQLTQH